MNLSPIVKLALILAIIVTLGGLWKWHTSSLINEGKAQVSLEWSKANEAARKVQEDERLALERERDALSRKYEQLRQTRKADQVKNDKEREDAIKNSSVAGNVCFDDRMRDAWNRAGGNTIEAPAGATKRSVDGQVPKATPPAGR